MIIIIIVQIGR